MTHTHTHTVLSVSLQVGGLGFLIGTMAIFLQDKVIKLLNVIVAIMITLPSDSMKVMTY